MKSDALPTLAAGTLLAGAMPSAREDATSRALKARSMRLADMQSALTKLKAMPSARVSVKHAAAEQAAMLKRRLEMMKQMLIGASPEVAKQIAAQIKSIAKELAGLARALATSGGGSAATPASASATPAATANGEDSGADGSAEAATPAVTKTPDAPADQARSNDEQGGTLSASQRAGLAAYTAQKTQDSRNSPAAPNDNDQEKAASKELKKALTEAINALRQLIAMIKNRSAASKKAAQDIREAEAQIREIERSMAKAESQDSNAPNATTALSPPEAAIETADVPAIGTGAAINVAA